MKVRINFVVTVATLILTFIFWLLALNMKEFFWDIEVYQFAVDSAKTGNSPYINRPGFDFMYHPIVLPILKMLSLVSPLKIVLPIIYLVATLILLTVLRSSSLIASPFKKSEGIVLFLLLPGFFGWSYLGLFSGNLSILGHIVLQIFGFQLMRRRRSHVQVVFCLAVLAFSLIKPYFLSYLVLFLAFSVVKFLIVGAVAVASFCALWFLLAVRDSEFYSQFTSNLTQGTFANQDLGFSLFSSIQALVGTWPALSLHVILALSLIAIYVKNRSLISINGQGIWLITIAIFINPRIKEYDAIFLLLMTYLAFALSSKTSKRVIVKTLTLSSFFGVVSVVASFFPPQLGATSIYFLASIAVVWSIWFAVRNPSPAKKWALSGSNRRPTD